VGSGIMVSFLLRFLKNTAFAFQWHNIGVIVIRGKIIQNSVGADLGLPSYIMRFKTGLPGFLSLC